MQRKEWQPIPTSTLRTARERLGWSCESAARALGVSSKTYERYEKAGRVPTDLVGDVIHALALDMEHPVSAKLRLVADLPADGADAPTTSEVLVVIRRASEAVEQLTVALRILGDRLPAAPADPLPSEEASLLS